MTSFKEYYYYLKTIPIPSNIQKEKHLVEEAENATILDLEKWSEYKVKRLVEETRMD